LYWLRPDEIKQFAPSEYLGIAVHHAPFREPGFAKEFGPPTPYITLAWLDILRAWLME
jgi:hypothetical protein